MSVDKRLELDVLAELAWEPGVADADIGVPANVRALTLSGHVDSIVEQHALEAKVTKVRRVRTATEEIEVRLRFDVKRGDEEIATAAIDRLARDASIPHDAVKVKVEKGWITLTGQVGSRCQKESAAHDVHGLFGVVGVSDRITVKPHLAASSIGNGTARTFYRSWFFDPKMVTVSAAGGKLRLVASREWWKFEGGRIS
jgi:osmotically-inducible protein OsmY